MMAIKRTFYSNYGKRLLDLALTIPACILAAPFLSAVALLVWVKLGPPVLFKQKRPGMEGRPFTIFKFRTMTQDRDARGVLLPDNMRLDHTGRFLRSMSLDELPELINVLRGEMSLVGPRPLLMRYMTRFTPLQARRHEVKPGLTGWAQVNGRNAICWQDKFNFDLWYVDHQCFWLDLKILALTIKMVVRREGISHPDEATMPEFMGFR